jgi:hypothetical protein
MAILNTRWQGEAIIDLKIHTLIQTMKKAVGREFGKAVIVDSMYREHSGRPADQ